MLIFSVFNRPARDASLGKSRVILNQAKLDVLSEDQDLAFILEVMKENEISSFDIQITLYLRAFVPNFLFSL
jgi:hypothetical protein